MKLPRDVSGQESVQLQRRFGYESVRQTGSHIRVRSTVKGPEHQVTIPAHNPLKVGTLSAILADIATHLKMDRDQLVRDLFER